ncbi:MAG: hypothetical protein ACRC1Z_15860 [Waterburya sp.]
MTQKYWEQKPTSFTEMVQLVEQYVQREIVQETKDKQLYYHNLNHALAVKRRANSIFQASKPILTENHSRQELTRLESLIGICGLAHDMVQIFEPTFPNLTRKRLSGSSELQTANKLLRYIQNLNQALTQALKTEELDSSLLFSDREQQIIRDAIMATICIRDPQGNKAAASWSSHAIYQPYLYDNQNKISIVGSIIALADLGALGMDGVEAYIQDGILIFLEDNPHLKELVINCHLPGDRLNPLEQDTTQELTRIKLLTMSRFIVDLAHERRTRFEQEIAGFIPQMRQILRNQVFVYLNQESINQVKSLVPNQSSASLSELIRFFCLNKIP